MIIPWSHEYAVQISRQELIADKYHGMEAQEAMIWVIEQGYEPLVLDTRYLYYVKVHTTIIEHPAHWRLIQMIARDTEVAQAS